MDATPTTDKITVSVKPYLALYYFDGCPFCYFVLDAIADLDVEVELRDIVADPSHRSDLVAARGRPTVPVLRIITPGGSDRWLPESADIIGYLQDNFGPA